MTVEYLTLSITILSVLLSLVVFTVAIDWLGGLWRKKELAKAMERLETERSRLEEKVDMVKGELKDTLLAELRSEVFTKMVEEIREGVQQEQRYLMKNLARRLKNEGFRYGERMYQVELIRGRLFEESIQAFGKSADPASLDLRISELLRRERKDARQFAQLFSRRDSDVHEALAYFASLETLPDDFYWLVCMLEEDGRLKDGSVRSTADKICERFDKSVEECEAMESNDQ